ncbi:hypothetical protein B0J13DRAFT_682472 [Dactylonectria estremocensis]|uniref:Rhodopsin domain-containing protein n=1 Tax=Dactylonectria estremocensis TaxID=1079267 RepID=A0A9P9CXX5_9HYPO|nr:hypothetical protein B0J13DRAFT_682472 [Dactylonectria estremocensis]
MAFYSEAPEARPFSKDKPTLLMSWWIALFCIVTILLRLSGRYIRVEKLLREDKIIAAVLLPLVMRAVCVHFVLRYGTNNVRVDGLDLTQHEIDKRVIGSHLVLASRIFYAAVLWIIKFATLEFVSRLAMATRKKSHALLVLIMRWTLVATFIAAVISNLAECQPFTHYWQVKPDPGGKCRQGFAQLVIMGVCNVITDIILIAFPISIILSSRIATKRKVLLVMLFSLGLIIVGITLYRVPYIIRQNGRQVDRTMWASVEILASTAVGNTVALGSFLRDSGVKRKKFDGAGNYSGYSGSRSQSQSTKLTRTAARDWEEESEDGQPGKTTEGLWSSSHGASHTPADSISKLDGTRKSGERPVSPTHSHDSLITRDQLQASVEIPCADFPYRPPSAIIAGASRDIQPGNTLRRTHM